jgi:hypothetical protein
MTTITQTSENDNALQRKFADFMKRFQVNKILRSVNGTKEKGIPAHEVFAALLGLAFTHKNLYRLLSSGSGNLPFGKDVVYRFLNKPCIKWEAFVSRLAAGAVAETKALTSEGRRCALIVDDTPFYRDRSKEVELLSRCYDHSKNRFYNGFTMLNVAWSDGQTLIPVDFQMLASGDGKNLLEGSHVKEDNRTVATKRRNDARRDKPGLVLDMLEQIIGTPMQARYVLFDSWFASPSAILSVCSMGYDVVARLKDHANYRYICGGEIMPLSQIYKKHKKRRGRSRYLLSVGIEIRHGGFEETVPAKLVFVRDRSNRKKWVALVSTDTSLPEDEIVALYGKRWDIEQFHKTMKQFLRLGSEFQSRSFDAIVAHTAIVVTRYIFLAVENRGNKDDRTLGSLFFSICDELQDISFAAAIDMIVGLLEQYLKDVARLAEEQICALVEQFIGCLPACIKDKLVYVVCES